MPPLQDRPSQGGDEEVLAPGAAIGRYVVLGLVGRGAMGQVYAAHDPELNRKVAIKLMRVKSGQWRDNERGRLVLMREARSIALLSHPSVVVIHDVGTLGDMVFIAMEFVEGHTVRYWTLAQRRPWREVLKVFAAAGAGLAAAHEKGLVHRDFKPDNVMIRADGEVRVLDFGLARAVATDSERRADLRQASHAQRAMPAPGASEDLRATRELGSDWPGQRDHLDPDTPAAGNELHESGTVVGTPAYMAPEQFAGGKPDARADQFSFCISLYEALYGEGPFQGNTVVERAANVSEGRVVAPPADAQVPRWIRKVLLRGLAVAPEQRWPSMKELLSRLDENARRLAEIDEWLAERGASHPD